MPADRLKVRDAAADGYQVLEDSEPIGLSPPYPMRLGSFAIEAPGFGSIGAEQRLAAEARRMIYLPRLRQHWPHYRRAARAERRYLVLVDSHARQPLARFTTYLAETPPKPYPTRRRRASKAEAVVQPRRWSPFHRPGLSIGIAARKCAELSPSKSVFLPNN